jgi:hypothetical protein
MPLMMVHIVDLLIGLVGYYSPTANSIDQVARLDGVYLVLQSFAAQFEEQTSLAAAYCNYLRQKDVEELKDVLTPKDVMKAQESLLRAHDAYDSFGDAIAACAPSSKPVVRFVSERQSKTRASRRVQKVLRKIIKNMSQFYTIVTQPKYSTRLEIEELKFAEGSKPLQRCGRLPLQGSGISPLPMTTGNRLQSVSGRAGLACFARNFRTMSSNISDMDRSCQSPRVPESPQTTLQLPPSAIAPTASFSTPVTPL